MKQPSRWVAATAWQSSWETVVPLTAGNSVELPRYLRVADGYFAADDTSFRGCAIDFVADRGSDDTTPI